MRVAGMANPGDIVLLIDGGVDEWNAWRKEHPGVVPNLEPRQRNLWVTDTLQMGAGSSARAPDVG
jgi:hypothetical protein